jgi:hypothetical protein
VVLAVALAAVAVVIRLVTGSMRDDDRPVHAGSVAPVTTISVTSEVPATAATRLPDPGQAELVVIDEHGVALPVTRDAGTAGAANAALHILVRSTPSTGPAVFVPTINEQVAGPLRDAVLERVRADYEQQRAAEGSTDGAPLSAPLPVRYLGYVVTAAEPGAVTLDVVATDADGSANPRVLRGIQMLWGGDDWQLVAQLDGPTPWPSAPVADLPVGYAPYAAATG